MSQPIAASPGKNSVIKTTAQFALKHNAVIMLLLLVVISSLISPVFLTQHNIFNVLRQISPLTLVSLGMLMVILTGAIDLSVGSIESLGGITVALLVAKMDFSSATGLVMAIILSILAGAVLGSVTGVFVSLFRMAPFVASLAMMTIARGIAYIVSLGQPIRIPETSTAGRSLTEMGSGSDIVLGIPYPVWIAIAGIIIFVFVSKFTAFGRMVIATGSNETAVRLAGINVRFYKFIVYSICGGLSGLAGVIVTSRAAIGAPVIGSGMELDAIAAVVIGGASLNGGNGTVGNTVVGVLIIGLIGNIMNLLSVPAYPQQVVKGLIIIAAVMLQGFQNKSRG